MSTHTSPTQSGIQRSLAAIVITDAVGFSRRMSQNEDAALALINRDLQLISSLCHQFEGNILKTTGDGVLMSFISAVQAVSCSMEIQKKFAALSEKESSHQHFVHRIGVHLGDVFFNNGDIMGSAVNITARLEAEAKPGSICMSQVVYEVVKSRISLEASYAGELSLKNIEEYVSAYHVSPRKSQIGKEPQKISEMTVPFIVPLNNTLKVLSTHPNSHTIKKLLLSAQQDNAKSNETLLAGASLKLLLESFTEKKLTLSECQSSLYKAARILGQTEEYFAAADIIIENLQGFYGEYEDIPQVDIFGTSASKLEQPKLEQPKLEQPKLEQPKLEEARSKQHFFERDQAEQFPVEQSVDPLIVRQDTVSCLHIALANRLEQDDNRIQIKKLLYCVCCHQWEDANDRIESISMLSIIQELYKQVNSLTELQYQLDAILTAHDLEGSFRAITHQIISECGIFYDDENPELINAHQINENSISA